MPDIVCVGILVADAIARHVNHLPERGKLSLVDNIELFSGGCAASTAIALSRLGVSTAIIGKVGNDGFGRFLKSALQEEKVILDGLCIDPATGTSASVVTVDEQGERTFLHYTGTNAVFNREDISMELIDKCQIVFVGGAMLMPMFDGSGCADFLKTAKAMGKLTALDTAWDSTGRWMDVLKPCMQYIDLFMPSLEEAVQLSGKKEPEEIADVFLSMGNQNVVIKLGSKGCFIKNRKGEAYTVPAFNVHAADTTGAGDCFCAGFLTGIHKRWNLKQCGIFANAVGAHSIMATGAITGIKSFEETIKFIQNNGLWPAFSGDAE